MSWRLGTGSTAEPEPCDGCPKGLLYLVSFEGQRLCRNCVRAFADARGWMDDWEQFLKPVERVVEAPVEMAAKKQKKTVVVPAPLEGWEPDQAELFSDHPSLIPVPKEQRPRSDRRRRA